MKENYLRKLVIIAFCLSLIAACGGGGGGVSVSQPSTAVLTLSTAVTGTIPAGTTINSYLATITLPAGVTVKTEPGSSATAAGVVTASGQASGARHIPWNREGLYRQSWPHRGWFRSRRILQSDRRYRSGCYSK
jgi:hypothetical protein